MDGGSGVEEVDEFHIFLFLSLSNVHEEAVDWHLRNFSNSLLVLFMIIHGNHMEEVNLLPSLSSILLSNHMKEVNLISSLLSVFHRKSVKRIEKLGVERNIPNLNSISINLGSTHGKFDSF